MINMTNIINMTIHSLFKSELEYFNKYIRLNHEKTKGRGEKQMIVYKYIQSINLSIINRMFWNISGKSFNQVYFFESMIFL